jgi:hypothetical protein
MKRWPAAAVAALIALGCSGRGGRSSTISRGQLASERRQLRSLDAEAGLMDELIGIRHVTGTFVRGHARYLRQAAHEHVIKLAQAKPEPGDEAALAQASANAVRLEQRFVGVLLLTR